ncbi:NAD kinase [Calidifontibacillus oryziterrae]|uniref:NAD kinase n=1 Tax=Calidifontibacillus oryziterrae TaxID=1191699 RepID=UPI0002DB6D9F|nr:NAD kinase [Calidifontibacillus oryziterrae]
MPNRRNLFFFYHHNDQTNQQVEQLKKIAADNNFFVIENDEEANIVVSIGGDGTFLQAVRKTGFRDDCLYTGINNTSSPSLYADFNINETAKLLDAMSNENIEVRRYPTIKVTIDDHTSFYCLNDCSIRSSIIKTFVMDVYIDNLLFETFRGDGMVVATPTGSTGYTKSLKGAVVDPMLPCIQLSELASLNNIKYRTLGSSLILSGERELTLKVVQDGNDHPIIGMDNEALSIQHIKKISIKLGDKRIKTVKLKDNSYWEKVHRKFIQQ